MNIGAYIVIFGVGAALMIIGFWIGYAYRATHKPDPLTPGERARILQAHLEAHRKFMEEPIKGRSHDYTIIDDPGSGAPAKEPKRGFYDVVKEIDEALKDDKVAKDPKDATKV